MFCVCILQPLHTSQTYMTFSLWGRVCLIAIVFKDITPFTWSPLRIKRGKKNTAEKNQLKQVYLNKNAAQMHFPLASIRNLKLEAEKGHKSKVSSRMSQWVFQEEILIVLFSRQLQPAWLAGSPRSLWPERQHLGKVITSRAVSQLSPETSYQEAFHFQEKEKISSLSYSPILHE